MRRLALLLLLACKHQPVGHEIDFDHTIHLVDARIPDHANRGDHVSLTFTWRCDKETGPGWQLLTHVFDSNGKADNLDSYGPLRETDASFQHWHQPHGPDTWQAGQTYTETLPYVIPAWATGTMTVYVGIWKKNDETHAVRMHVVSGPSDGENRGIAGKIEVVTR